MKAWSRLVRWLDTREPGEPLALLRIATGCNVFAAVASVALPGLVPILWLTPEHGGIRMLPDKGSWLIGLLGGPTPTVVWPLVALTLAASALLAVGWASRIAAFVALQGFLALAWINGDAGGSYDPLITNVLWLLVLAESDATLSVRSKLQTGAWSSGRAVTAWPRWLVVLQLLVMYCSTGLQKVSAAWVPGGESDALYYILQQPSWRRFDMSWVAWIYPATQAATLSVWLFEVFAPLLVLVLWFRSTRTRPGVLRAVSNRLRLRDAFAAYGVAMHLGIHALMAVGPFSLVSASLYLCLFTGDEWRALGRRLAAQWQPRPAAPSPPETTALPGA